MSGEVDIRSVSVKEAAKLLRLPAKIIRAHLRRDLPARDDRIDLVVYTAWLNRQEQKKKGATDGGA